MRETTLDREGAPWLVGVDIGGTFTDLVAVNIETGRRATAKVLTTPADPGEAIGDALRVVERDFGVTLAGTKTFVHATTLAINTVIERRGARVGVVATRGFTDVLEMGHANRYDMFALRTPGHPPLVERSLRVPIDERITSDGAVLTPVDRASLEAAVEHLIAAGVESVAVCLLHAYKNADHEGEVREVFAERAPDLPITLSSEVAPIIGEYERSVVTAVNAYVSPKLSVYLGQLTQSLHDGGYRGEAHIMRSDGGWFSAQEASANPVRILESGPAAGAIAGAEIVVSCDAGLSIAFDMGGTTAKACLIVDGQPAITDELEVSRLERFKKGSGLPIRLPSVDLIEIGAGGGSIAAISPLGLLQVGPESGGAVPGPACYGRGGTRPTVTDADLVLGYLDPANFAGGTMTLDLDAAKSALYKQLVQRGAAEDTTAAAWGVHDLVNENMALAISLHCVEHGVHPAGVSMVATGGAGPVHASGIMEKIGARSLICPVDVGVASAFGLLLAPRTTERTITDITALASISADELERRLARIAGQIGGDTQRSGGPEVRRSLRARLRGQGYEVTVPLPHKLTSLDEVAAAFRAEYALRFGRPPAASGEIEIVDWAVRLVEQRDPLPEHDVGLTEGGGEPLTPRSRSAYWGPALGWQETAIFDRSSLPAGQTLSGPAVIEEATSTVVVRPGQRAVVDRRGNITITSAHEEGQRT